MLCLSNLFFTIITCFTSEGLNFSFFQQTGLCINILLYSNSCFSKTVKETQKQRKEAKFLKQLDKQKREEAAEKEKLEQRENKKGSIRLVLVQL